MYKRQVVCGQTYHFKFAIADCNDGVLDTGVFLEGGSFSSDAVNVSVATVTGDTTVIENCTNAQFIFTRPESQIKYTVVAGTYRHLDLYKRQLQWRFFMQWNR